MRKQVLVRLISAAWSIRFSTVYLSQQLRTISSHSFGELDGPAQSSVRPVPVTIASRTRADVLEDTIMPMAEPPVGELSSLLPDTNQGGNYLGSSAIQRSRPVGTLTTNTKLINHFFTSHPN